MKTEKKLIDRDELETALKLEMTWVLLKHKKEGDEWHKGYRKAIENTINYIQD